MECSIDVELVDYREDAHSLAKEKPCCTQGPHPESLQGHLQRPILYHQVIYLAARTPPFHGSRKARVSVGDIDVYDDQECASFFANPTRRSTSAAR